MTEKPGPSPCNTESAIFSASILDNTSSDWAFVNAVADMEKVIPWYRHSNTEFSQSVSPVAQSCPTLCDPMDCSLSGFAVHGILQARIREWVAISFSRDLPDPGIESGSPTL